MKPCTKCKQTKDLSEFYKHPTHSTGFNSHCKSCVSLQSKKWRADNSEKKLLADKLYREQNQEKLRDYFKAHYKKLSEDKKESRKEYGRWYYHNIADKEKLREYTRNYFASRPGLGAHKNSVRRDGIKQRTPKWADLQAIKDFYLNCPKGYHVDHIIPLKGKNVTGLHVLGNLQYLPASDNIKKGNRIDLDSIQTQAPKLLAE